MLRGANIVSDRLRNGVLMAAAIAAFIFATRSLWSPMPKPAPGTEADRSSSPETQAGRQRIERALNAATKRTGVPIRYIDHDEEIAADRDMLPSGHGRLETRLEILERALRRYPRSAREALVTEVHLYDTLWDGDHQWGGFASCDNGIIRLAANAGAWSVHHEIGHMVWCMAPEIHGRWEAISAGQPRMTVDDAFAQEGHDTPPGLFESGFLTPYGSTQAKEDFCEFAAMAIVQPGRLDNLAARHDRIREKRDLVVDTYYTVDPNLEFFGD